MEPTSTYGKTVSKLAKIKARDAEGSSSSISILQSAINQQVEMLQSLHYKLKTEICTVTQLCPRPGRTDLAGLKHGISHQKFDLNVTIGHESASRGPSVPSLGIENCNLHGTCSFAEG